MYPNPEINKGDYMLVWTSVGYTPAYVIMPSEEAEGYFTEEVGFSEDDIAYILDMGAGYVYDHDVDGLRIIRC